jgi:hypothetical protein
MQGKHVLCSHSQGREGLHRGRVMQHQTPQRTDHLSKNKRFMGRNYSSEDHELSIFANNQNIESSVKNPPGGLSFKLRLHNVTLTDIINL